jgi:hypothetical protein
MARKKKWYIAIGSIVIIVLIVLAIIIHSKHVYFRSPVIFLPQPEQFITTDKGQSISANQNSYSLTNLKEISGGVAVNEMSYQDALQIYQGRVVQLNPNCRASPVTISVPPKSVIMIGNQSQWQRSVIVGPRTYSIAPYDYVLAAFNMPGAFAITCDSVQSVGIIAVQ